MHNAFIWQILFAVAFFVSIFDVRPVMRMVANLIQVNASTPQIVKSNVLSLIACETHAQQIEVKVQIKRTTQSVHACGVERADAWAIEKLMVRGFTSTLSQKNAAKNTCTARKLLQFPRTFSNKCGFDLLSHPGAACSHWRGRAARLHWRSHWRFQSEIAVALFGTAISVFNCVLRT